MKKRNPPPPKNINNRNYSVNNSNNNFLNSLKSNIFQGFSFGAGSEVGRSIVRNVVQSPQKEKKNELNKKECEDLLENMLKACNQNIEPNCDNLLNIYKNMCLK